jgi:hypothetical protein
VRSANLCAPAVNLLWAIPGSVRDGRGDGFLVDVQAEVMHDFVHGCLVAFIADETGASHALPVADRWAHAGIGSMKSLRVLALGVLLAGCSTSTPRTASLTADRAGVVARGLANAKARSLYDCQPFADGSPARFVGGRWLWHDRRAHGLCDLEASVELAEDGSARRVDVILLDGRESPRGLYQILP